MKDQSKSPLHIESRWLHRLAAVVVCTTYPLIWVGGLVTTQKAGMAVPDWPSTYGYNLFLYPWQTWIFGPFDLFIEHGHRLLASLVGMLCIALVIVAWRTEGRRWITWFAVIGLLMVIGQGLLGGIRVEADEVLMARIHGCVAPLCLAWLVYVEVISSRRWQNLSPAVGAPTTAAMTLHRWSFTLLGLAYLQIVLGSLLRHVTPMTLHSQYRVSVLFHVVTAVAVLLTMLLLAIHIQRHHREARNLVRLSRVGVVAVLFQFGLGISTWIFKFNWPEILPGKAYAPGLLIEAGSAVQAGVVTGHVAVGSMILAVAVVLVTYAVGTFPISWPEWASEVRSMKGVVA